MATVKEILPRKKEPSLKKVAAYCRVITFEEKARKTSAGVVK